MQYDILTTLNLMELAAHQSLTELTSDCSKRQSCGELIERKIIDVCSKD
jgi:hypothetical protein